MSVSDGLIVVPGVIFSELGGPPKPKQKCVGASVCVEADPLTRTGYHCPVSEKYAAYCCTFCNKWTHKHDHNDVCAALHIWFKTGTNYEALHEEGPQEMERRQWAKGVLSLKAAIFGKTYLVRQLNHVAFMCSTWYCST